MIAEFLKRDPEGERRETQLLRVQLSTAAAAARQAEGQLQSAEAAGRRWELAAAELQAVVAALEAKVAALHRQLAAAAQAAADSKALAAENARLAAQNEAALRRMRELASALERQQEGAAVAATPATTGGAGAPSQQQDAAQQTQPEPAAAEADEHEAERLRRELADARAQLATVLQENAELAERLLQVAFEPSVSADAPSADGAERTFSPLRRGTPRSTDKVSQRRASEVEAAPPLARVSQRLFADAQPGVAAPPQPEALALASSPFSVAAASRGAL